MGEGGTPRSRLGEAAEKSKWLVVKNELAVQWGLVFSHSKHTTTNKVIPSGQPVLIEETSQ